MNENLTLYVVSLQVIYELTFDGHKCIATEVDRHDTGTSAVMNCSSYKVDKSRQYFVAGLDDYLQLYEIAMSPERLAISAHPTSSVKTDNRYSHYCISK